MVNLGSSPPLATKTNPDDSFAITIAPLSLAEAYGLADDPANGAVVVMSGTVRNQTEGKAVEYLEYQAYQPMAIAVFNSIAAEIRNSRQDVNRIVIACQYAIDTLKHNAPIWKKEWFKDGASTWVSIGACEQGEDINC